MPFYLVRKLDDFDESEGLLRAYSVEKLEKMRVGFSAESLSNLISSQFFICKLTSNPVGRDL